MFTFFLAVKIQIAQEQKLQAITSNSLAIR